MKSAYILVGITFGKFRQVLSENKHRYTFGMRFFFRGFFILFNSIFASFLSFIEKKRYHKAIDQTIPIKAPIFIIGHWRTGSTLLHQFFQQDPSLTTPSHYQVVLPEFFISGAPYYRPVLKIAMGKTRPMDSMKIGLDEPQEDEYALYKMTGISPFNNLVFPTDSAYFLNSYSDFIPDKDQLGKWKNAFNYFYRKISFVANKQVVFKNPFHTLRIDILKDMFPNAKFVHIYRHPYNVVPSTINMWKTVGMQNSMNSINHDPEVSDVASFYEHMLSYVNKKEVTFSEESFINVCYEELEINPIETMRKIYQQFEMDFTQECKDNLTKTIKDNSGYVKNLYSLSEQDKLIIDFYCSHHYESLGYKQTLKQSVIC
ncbi:MAG: sulfotransferase [Bacteroidota bacterium]